LSKIKEAYTGNIKNIVDEVTKLLQEVIDWERLDSGGDEFAEITYRILEKEDDFYDASPGGMGRIKEKTDSATSVMDAVI